MSSQDSVTEILNCIALWSPEEVTKKLDEVIPVLISFVQQSQHDTVLQLKCLRAMLVTSLPCVAIDRADSLLLQHAVPAARQLFLQIVNDITVVLQDGGPHISTGDLLVRHIQMCQEVLDCLCSATCYVASLCSVDCILVQSVPGNVAFVLTQAFQHCKQSESLYGTMFEEMHDVLTSLFQKCCELQTHFLAAMTSVIKFNCFFEDELVLLTEVVDSMSEVGQLAAALDVKAMVEIWKGYVKLAEVYCEHLKPRLDVAKPLISLSQQVVANLEATVCLDVGESKLITRNIKVISFQLKVILKLCEQYVDYLGDCYEELLMLLISLYRMSGCGLQFMEASATVMEVVDRHAGIATEPLVTSLLSSAPFPQKYFKVVGDLKENGKLSCLGLVLFSATVLKKLIHADSCTRKFWLCDEKNILDSVFQVIGGLHSELSWPLQIPGILSGGEPPRMVGLYEHVLTHLAGFTMSVSAMEFPLVETVLLKNILQTNAWKALLAIDLWCVVARYGSAELCFQHVRQLSTVLEQMPPVQSRPEREFLTSLLNRLFPLLSQKHLASLPEYFPIPRHLSTWAVIPTTLVPPEVAEQLQKHFMSCFDAWVKQPLSTENYEALVCSLSVVAASVVVIPPGAGMLEKVISLWHRVGNDVSEKQMEHMPHWLHRLVFQLCDASAALLPQMFNKQMVQVLSGMNTLSAVRCSSVKLCIIMTLRQMGNKFIATDVDQVRVFQLIAQLFSTFLKDRNALVCEAVLESFKYFAHVTQHAEIVVTSVKDDETSQQKVAAYLQKNLPHKGSLNTLKQYLFLQSQNEYVHKCCIPSGSVQEVQPAKKFKGDRCGGDDVEKVIDQYLNLAKQVMGYLLQKEISCDEKLRLKKASTEILKYCDEK